MSEPSHKSQSAQKNLVTDASRESYDRIFGDKTKPQRGKWVLHPVTKELVPAEEYVAPAPDDKRLDVVSDRYMEGTAALDGTDIGSRPKRREYMRRNNLVDTDDCKGMWERAAKEREQIRAGKGPGSKERRETIGRALYEQGKKRRR